MRQMRVKFFQSFNSVYARSSHFTEPVIQHHFNANCKPHLLYGSEVTAWNCSELPNIAYAFNSAMCRIYNVCLKGGVERISIFLNKAHQGIQLCLGDSGKNINKNICARLMMISILPSKLPRTTSCCQWHI